MKISFINGSQKTGESNSGLILDRINSLINGKHEVEIYNSGINLFTDEAFKKIVSGDVIILAFPLFVSAVPSHTLKMLIELEKTVKRENANNLIMYTIINCGFYEGRQNNVAFKIIENWCGRSGVKFGGGIGQGGGEMLGKIKRRPLNKGPFNNLERALHGMLEKIELKQPLETIYLNPNFPRFLFKILGTRYWNNVARKNGLKKKDIKRRI